MYQSTDPTAECSLPAPHLTKELKKSALSICWLMTQPVRRLSLGLCLTKVLRAGSYCTYDIHGEVGEWSMNFYICSILRHSKDIMDHLTVSA